MWKYMATVSFLNMHVVTSHGAIHPKTKTMQFHYYDVKPYTINQSLLVISLLPLDIRRRIKNVYFPISCRRVNPSAFDCARIL